MDSTRFSVVIVRNPSVNGCITVAFSSGEQQLHSFKCFVPISNLESRLPIQFEYCHVITSEVMSHGLYNFTRAWIVSPLIYSRIFFRHDRLSNYYKISLLTLPKV